MKYCFTNSVISTKRPQGIGSIEKRGDKYQLIISLGYDANGKKIRRKKPGYLMNCGQI
jgi:hypothetical protein